MKFIKYFIFLLLAIPVAVIAQPSGSWPISYGSSAPSYTPSSSGTRLYFNTATNELYTWRPAPTSAWIKYPKAFDQIGGCAAPSYTPTARQSTFAVNSCAPKPELYQYTGSSWACLNCYTDYVAGTGIDITGSTISNTGDLSNTNELQTLSIAGQDLTLSNGGGTVTIPSTTTLDASDIVVDNSGFNVLTGTDAQAAFDETDAALSNTLNATTAFNGDVSGTYNDLQLGTGVVGSNELASTTVTPGTYANATVTFDADGRATSASSGSTYLDSLDYEIQTIRQSLGTSYNDVNMGAFTGTVLTDNTSIKTVIQGLGDAIQAVADADKPYWNLNGNTNVTGKFIGTTDTTPVEIRINNTVFFRKKYTSSNDDALAFGPGSGLLFRDRISGISRSFAFGVDVLPVEDGNNRNNAGFGYSVLKNCTTCSRNAGIGFEALRDMTTGTGNMAMGYTALQKATTGSYNVGVGVTTLPNVTTGSFNVALGFQAGQFLTTGGTNVAIGYNSLNTAVFTSRCVAVGAGAGFSNTSPNQIFIGTGAGVNHNSGSNCIEICNNPSIAASPTYNYGDVIMIGTNLSNSSALSNIIGIGSLPTAANRVKIGRSTDTRIDFNQVPLKMDVAPTEGQHLKTISGVLTPVADTVSITLEVANAVTSIESASYPYVINTSFWRVPARLNGWKVVGASYAFYSAASGGNTVVALRLNGSSDIASTTISAGTTVATSTGITQSVVTGDLLQATLPNSQTFSSPAKGLFVTIYLTR